jgi:hypothetical protein
LKEGESLVEGNFNFRCQKRSDTGLLLWNQITGTDSQNSSAQSSLSPLEGTKCARVGENKVFATGILKCWYQGGSTLAWSRYPLPLVPTKNAVKYQGIAEAGKACDSTGDTFDVPGGYLECRYVKGGVLQWIKINSALKTFTNAKSPNGLDVCRLRNADVLESDRPANTRAGARDPGQVAGFPFFSRNYFNYKIDEKNVHKALIVGVDFPELRGVDADLKAANDYDKRMMAEWYAYYSGGDFVMETTSIDYWLHAPKKASTYTLRGTYDGTAVDSNQKLDGVTQEMIDLITQEVDLSKFQTVYLIFPDGELTLDIDWVVRDRPFKIKEGKTVNLNFFGWGLANEMMVTMRWAYYVHESLHDFPILGHAPGNGLPFNIMTNQSGISMAMNPWEQFRLGWLEDNQIYCAEKSKLETTLLSLSPLEREDKQTKLAIIKISATKAIAVEAHGIDKWSSFKTNGREFAPGFYGVMAYIVNLNDAGPPPVAADGSHIDGTFWAYFQKVDGKGSFVSPSIWQGPKGENFYDGPEPHLEDYVALLGDSFIIEGVKITLVATGDYETIEITKL